MKTRIAAGCMLVALSACTAHRGTLVEWETANQVRNGMTQDEVIELMGEEPNTVIGNGEELVWSYAQVNTITGSTYSRAVRFKFDQNGRTYGIPDGGVGKFQMEHDL